MTLVSFEYLMHSHRISDEPFIFAWDASQVFYFDDDEQSKWQVAIATKPRDLYLL